MSTRVPLQSILEQNRSHAPEVYRLDPDLACPQSPEETLLWGYAFDGRMGRCSLVAAENLLSCLVEGIVAGGLVDKTEAGA